MKKNPALIAVGSITAVTVGLTFIQPTIIHQLVIWVSGMFALLVVLAVIALSAIEDVRKPEGFSSEDMAIILAVRGMREQHMRDEIIARLLNTDIDVIKAIPR